jgi:hypothetical protein
MIPFLFDEVLRIAADHNVLPLPGIAVVPISAGSLEIRSETLPSEIRSVLVTIAHRP